MTPEERTLKILGWPMPPGEGTNGRPLFERAVTELRQLQNEIDRLRADLEAARANARHYAGIALEQQNQKDNA